MTDRRIAPYLAIILGLLVSITPAARAQTRPELPNFQPPSYTPGRILPPIPIPRDSTLESLFPEVRVFIRDVRIDGNTVIADEELDSIAAPYEGRQLSFSDLENLRDQLTLAYLNKGFVSSGAVIPDQEIRNGVVDISIIEGRLAPVEIETTGRLRRGYVGGRLSLDRSQVVNVNVIEEALQILRQNPRVGGVEAVLAPGGEQGESLLRVQVSEARPQNLLMRFDNYQAVSVGSARGLADFTHRNVTARGDTLSGTVRTTHGLRALYLAYGVPLNARDTTLSASADLARSRVVEKPFADLDIKSRLDTFGLTLLHPLRRTLGSQFDVFFTGEYRRSQSFLLGSGFQFTEDLTEDGAARAFVLRAGQTWTRQGVGEAITLRNAFSIGLDAFGATAGGNNDVADGQFLSWLGQVQWARRIQAIRSGAQVIVRFDAQLANSPLPGMEKFALGGHATVRGYRENELVRDNGVVASVESRVPIVTFGDAANVLEVAPFLDIGRAWDRRGSSIDGNTLPGAGVGLRLRMRNGIQGEVYWGHAFKRIPHPGEWSLQDNGIHLGLAWSLP